jgi:hypothetical protein
MTNLAPPNADRLPNPTNQSSPIEFAQIRFQISGAGVDVLAVVNAVVFYG